MTQNEGMTRRDLMGLFSGFTLSQLFYFLYNRKTQPEKEWFSLAGQSVYSVANKNFEFMDKAPLIEKWGADFFEKHHWSLFNELNLETGASRNTPLPLTNGHDVKVLPGNRAVCSSGKGGGKIFNILLVDLNDASVIRNIVAPRGYRYSGHVEAWGDKVYAPIYPNRYDQHRPEDLLNGKIQVFDSKNLELIETNDSGGQQPHQIKYLPKLNKVAVTHYSFHDYSNVQSPYLADIHSSHVAIYDADHFHKEQHFSCEENASFAHLEVDADSRLVCPLVNYAKPSEAGLAKLFAMSGASKAHFTPSLLEGVDEGFALPLPVYVIDPKVKSLRKLLSGKHNLRGAITLAHNKMTKSLLIAFKDSDCLVKFSSNYGRMQTLSNSQLGLPSHITGVADIAGTPYVVVTGLVSGAAIVDVRNFEVVKRYSFESVRGIHAST
jgi:hypothetical protein